MAAATASCYCASQFLRPNLSPSIKSTITRSKIQSFSNISLSPSPSLSSSSFSSHYISRTHKPLLFLSNSSSQRLVLAAATTQDKNSKPDKKVEEIEVEEEEELPWIQEKALDLVEFTGSVTQAIPGPRVGHSSFPWMLTVPLAYLGITFVFAFVKTIRKFNSPKHLRRKLVSKNAVLCKSIDELFEKGSGVEHSDLKKLMQKTGFKMEEILRKYIRYVMNEKPFNPELVANLIQLRKASMLDDSQVAETLKEISERIVKEKGPVVMDMSGYTERGFKRKIAVQALFGKVYYLAELPAFCSKGSLKVKEIFGVSDEDAEKLRMHTHSEAGDMESLEKMVDVSEASEDSGDDSSFTS